MKTRLKDLADHLNLSPALVSGVLNNRPNVWASAETRARIHETAKRLNYHPNATARALSRGKTCTVGLVYRRLDSLDYRLAYTGLVDVFSERLQRAGYDLMVSNFSTQEEVLSHLERFARTRSVDAVILWGREQDTEEQGNLLESLGMPFLIKGRFERTHPNWHQVDFDHEWMMANAVEHLANQGRKRLAYIGFPHEDAFVQALRRGFCQAHERTFGFAPEPCLVAGCLDDLGENQDRVARWLRMSDGEQPDGIVIGAGNAAWLALETCLARVGRKLGPSPGDFGAAGIVSHSFSLVIGQADVYQGIELDNVARMASPTLIGSVLQGVPTEPVVRFRPDLLPARTLDLINHGVSFTRDVLQGADV